MVEIIGNVEWEVVSTPTLKLRAMLNIEGYQFFIDARLGRVYRYDVVREVWEFAK